MEQILLIIQIIIALALVIIVLIQRSDSDGMGLGGGSGGLGLLSGRAKANALTRTTAILAALFMLNSLLFAVVSAYGRTSIIETIEAQASREKADEPAVPLATDAPSAAIAAPVTPAQEQDIVPAPEQTTPAASVPRAE